MKKEVLLPYQHQTVALKNIFGEVNVGTVESVDDNCVVLSAKRGRKVVNTVIALEYVTSFAVSKQNTHRQTGFSVCLYCEKEDKHEKQNYCR